MSGSPLHLDRVVFFGRTFEEYLDMFALTLGEIEGRKVLDCPSGPDGFVAEAKNRGLNVTGSDPMYHQSVSGLRRLAMADIESTMEKIARDPNFHKSNLENYHNEKRKAMEQFLEDYALGIKQGRYVAASLPRLPFADGQFDLVLSGHLLFCYASPENGGIWPGSPLDLDFHRNAIKELLRVCKSELRLYPICAMNSSTEWNPIAKTLAKEFADHGFQVETKPSRFFQTQTEVNLTLILRRA